MPLNVYHTQIPILSVNSKIPDCPPIKEKSVKRLQPNLDQSRVFLLSKPISNFGNTSYDIQFLSPKTKPRNYALKRKLTSFSYSAKMARQLLTEAIILSLVKQNGSFTVVIRAHKRVEPNIVTIRLFI